MKNFKNGFTVTELLTVIAIIMIFIVGASSFNFRAISDKQNLEVLLNSVISQIETVRTNALIGKGVLFRENSSDTGVLIVPKYRKIEFSKTKESFSQLGTGIITTSYKIDDSVASWIEDEKTSLGKFTSISRISCTTDDVNFEEFGAIYFEGNKYTLKAEDIDNTSSNKCLSNFTTITIDIQYKNFTETIKFNTVSGLVENVKK